MGFGAEDGHLLVAAGGRGELSLDAAVHTGDSQRVPDGPREVGGHVGFERLDMLEIGRAIIAVDHRRPPLVGDHRRALERHQR